ncbi:hypothetical protein V8B55DRAFT_1499565 [Mucor lusitanicus]|uniref:Inhibitor I9 domain-containing protein n=2 Tax=Mucor circinelloides f. lusitanicus TaxID=29924 RepID=A0A168MY83_MUCCL|nr:hypothetical protein FB192DRAFT_1358159 [Mucor lusitanicus]OAD05526.1 hypothetical protein MUCCIDRAFT_109393 [Mucor lusitanicus CBS 277.49]
MLKIITFILFLFVALIAAADINYIMALKSPVTDKTYKEARADVESAGGKVTYEFRAAFKAVLVSLPSEHVSTLSSKPYVEFMEEDKSVHIA